MSSEQTPERREVIHDTTLPQYIEAHAQENGGVRGFLRSNLFAALLVFFLGQCFVVGGVIVAMYWRTSALLDWKAEVAGQIVTNTAQLKVLPAWQGGVDASLKRMDEQGTLRSHMQLSEITSKVGGLDERTRKIEKDTEHLDVLEAEHKRLSDEVEALKNARK